MKKTNKKIMLLKMIIIFGIIILPFIYSLVYLKAFWDPYSSLDKLPVAIVNSDDCEKNCKGDEIIKTLKEREIFNFSVVGKTEAKEGVINKDYYAMIEIPKDFTTSLKNAANKDRKQVSILYMPNSKTNYLATQITGKMVKELEFELNSDVNKQIVVELTTKLEDVPNQLKQVSSNLTKIYNGANELNSGTSKLNSGINNLSNNYKEFNNGIGQLNGGINTLQGSYGTLNSSIGSAYDNCVLLRDESNDIPNFVNAIGNLKTSNDTLNTNINNYKSASDAMIDDVYDVYQVVNDYIILNPGVKTNAEMARINDLIQNYLAVDGNGLNPLQNMKNDLNDLVSSSDSIKNGFDNLYNESSKLSNIKTGIDSLEAALAQLKNQSNNVLTGIGDINKGINAIDYNAGEIDSGLGTLNAESNALVEGANNLSNGAQEIKNTLDEKISDAEKDLEGLVSYAGGPVIIEEDNYGNVKTYGIFFSPYFISLSLWVGGILILMGLYYDPDNRFKVLSRNSENRALRLVLYNVIGIGGAVILAYLLKLILGFEVTSELLYYCSCILISQAFLAIIMFLFFVFKDVGKFLALVLLILGLAACAGTFPIETTPSFYGFIHSLMPMTYSVDLLRESLVSINSSFVFKDILILSIILVVFTGLTLLIGILKTKKEQDNM